MEKKIVKVVTKVVLPKVTLLPKKEKYFEPNIRGDKFEIEDTENTYTMFDFKIDELPHCCGVYEIGNIDLNDATVVSLPNFNKALDAGLLELLKQETMKKGIHTFVANLVNNPACNVLRNSFKRTGLFTCVKTFKNYSGSTIDMWISRN